MVFKRIIICSRLKPIDRGGVVNNEQARLIKPEYFGQTLDQRAPLSPTVVLRVIDGNDYDHPDP